MASLRNLLVSTITSLLVARVIAIPPNITDDVTPVIDETTSFGPEQVSLPLTTTIVTKSDDVVSTVVAVPDDGRFCNTTVTYTVKTECISCALNTLIGCPPGLVQLTQDRGEADCTYVQSLSSDVVIHLAGCRHNCIKTITFAICCPGFWGLDCNDCPSGSALPCSGHGKCFDGFNGNGTCLCQPGFSGFACELCEQNFYGIDCKKECSCVNGVCDSGIDGTGSCTCDPGYGGVTCAERLISCDDFACPDNSRCIQAESNLTCVCQYGYGYDIDGICQPINRCSGKNRPCDKNALCVPTGPALFECACVTGYQGDGFVCSPVDPCETDFGGCVTDSTKCVNTGPGQRQCICLEGFQNYTEGEGCKLLDVCSFNDTLCHSHASCATTGPWQVECLCETGYIGDGQNCYGNIVERLKELNENDEKLKGQFRYALQLLNTSAYSDALTKHGPFTWFVATDTGFDKYFSRRELRDLFGNPDLGSQLLRQHIIASTMSLSELANTTLFYSLEGSPVGLVYQNKVAKFELDGSSTTINVFRPDVIASNGVLHVVDTLFDEPVMVSGGTKKSISSVLLSEPKYETLCSLLEVTGLLSKLNSTGHFTVFATSNAAWSNLPKGTLDYFISIEGKAKLLVLLENHIVEGPYILATDLVNLPRFVSAAGFATQVSVSRLGRIVLNGAANVTLVDVPASNGFVHQIDNLLIADSLLPLLPHRCDVTAQRPIRGNCGRCSSELTCPWSSDIPLNETGNDCRYWVNVGELQKANFVAFDGCYRLCNRSYTISKCCDGFYSEACYPCPGGFQNPCFGRGVCDDGYRGSGACACEAPYSGNECELCADVNSFGPNCTNKCSCLHGTCDNRVAGSVGRCKPYTCNSGYSGTNCDVQLQRCDRRSRLRCHAFADCVRASAEEYMSRLISILANSTDELQTESRYIGESRSGRRVPVPRSSCRCKQGYRGPGTFCEEINPCLESDRGGCHSQADCIKTGPGQSECRCSLGWVGDGFFCFPSSPCQNHSECHENAMCIPSIPNQYVCSCLDGYHGNGTTCVLGNICIDKNGGCHANAECEPVKPGEAKCSCRNGYGGNGLTCFSTLGNEIGVYPQLSAFNDLLQWIPRENFYLDDITNNYTLFLPNNEAIEMVLKSTSAEFWKMETNVLNLLSYHVVMSSISTEDLKSNCQGQKMMTLSNDENSIIQCNTIGEEITVNGAALIAGGLSATNGYIYIINKVLEPRSAMIASTMLEETLAFYPQFEEFLAKINTLKLSSTIDDLNDYTLFIPFNQTIPVEAGRRYMSFFVVPRQLTLFQLKAMSDQKLNTLLGSSLQQQMSFTRLSDKLFINQLSIIEPRDVRTANGVIHSLEGSLSPVINRCDMSLSNASQVIQCCAGYYGTECAECPGGPDATCSGHGKCDDGINGLGTCTCKIQYGGDRCETCLQEDCSQDQCSFFNGGCDLSATCQVDEDGEVVCSCRDGFAIQNSVCVYTANDCEIANGGCSQHASCKQFDTSSDSTVSITCSCLDGFVGDGYVCNGNLWPSLLETPLAAQFYQSMKLSLPAMLEDGNRIISTLSDPTSNVTLFVPATVDVTQLLSADELQSYIVNNTQILFTADTMPNNGTIDLIALNGIHLSVRSDWNTTIEEQLTLTVNNVSIIKPNIRFANGVVHISQRPLHISLSVSEGASKYHENSALVYGTVIPLLVCVIVVVSLVKWRKSLQLYLQRLHFERCLHALPSRSQMWSSFGERGIIYNPAAEFGSSLNLVPTEYNDDNQPPFYNDQN